MKASVFCFFLFFIGPSFLVGPVNAQETKTSELYLCPMKCEGLEFHSPGDCPVCGMHLEKVEEESFFDEEMIADVEASSHSIEKQKRNTSLMPGLDTSFYYMGWIGLFFATLGGWFWGDKLKIASRKDLRKVGLRSRMLGALFRSRIQVRFLQVIAILLFVFVIYAGLVGNQDPGRNIAPVLTWNIWWMSLIFFAFFLGQSWCTICPWMALPDLVSRGFSTLRETIFLNLRWPKKLRNIYPALFLFSAMTWVELVYDAPYNPSLTAWMGVAMVILATLVLLVFERKSFCRYTCMVGRVTGIFGTTGLLAFRRDDSKVCKQCVSKACYHGSEKGLPCPTFEFMGAMNDASNCTMCTECLHTCPHDNILVEWRAPFTDLFGPHRKRMDESVFLIAILGFAIFHGLEMVPFWREGLFDPFWQWLSHHFFDPGFLTTYTFMMFAFIALTYAVFAIFVAGSRVLSGNLVYTTRTFFIAFAYVTLPISLAYHIAHNSLHFFYEGSKLFRLLSDPMGWGWDLFGSANSPLTMLIPMPILWGLQLFCMWAGQFVAVGLVGQSVRRLIGNRAQVLRAKIPLVIMVSVFASLCLWLLFQPMEMRTG